jgi:hypothetical protein
VTRRSPRPVNELRISPQLRSAPARTARSGCRPPHRKLGRQRNRYMHDPFLLDFQNRTIVRMEMTADKHVRHGMVDLEVDELNALRDKITARMDELDRLWTRVLAEVPPWPRTQFEQSPGIRLHHTDRDIGATRLSHQPPSSGS